MLLDFIFIGLGIAGLYYGAEWLVRGAARIAGSYNIPPLVIGLTVVSFGTSMPELVVSLSAVLGGADSISVGNVVGSNIANVALILGVTGMIIPIGLHARLIRREIPFMLGVSILTYLFAIGGEISRIEGLILFIGVLLFTGASYYFSQHESSDVIAEAQEFDELSEFVDGSPINRPMEAGRVLLGIIILIVAAQLTVNGATGIAEAAGISDVVIGLTLVALGTSLPELATSVVAAIRRESDISVGNVVGSNIFNLLAILGVTAMVKPIQVEAVVLRYDFPIMIAISLLLVPFALNQIIGRRAAMVFLAAYIAFTIFLFVR